MFSLFRLLCQLQNWVFGSGEWRVSHFWRILCDSYHVVESGSLVISLWFLLGTKYGTENCKKFLKIKSLCSSQTDQGKWGQSRRQKFYTHSHGTHSSRFTDEFQRYMKKWYTRLFSRFLSLATVQMVVEKIGRSVKCGLDSGNELFYFRNPFNFKETQIV